MKILQINNHHRVLGGSETVFFNTSALLRANGHDVVTFSARSDDDLPSLHSSYFPGATPSKGAKATDIVRYVHNRKAALELARLIESEGPFDLAHLHIYYGRLTASILPVLKRFRIPIVQTLHEYKMACPVYTLERAGAVCEKCVEGTTLNSVVHRCKNGSLVDSAVALFEYWASRLQGDRRLIDTFICVSDFQNKLMRRAKIPARKLTTLHNFVSHHDVIPKRRAHRTDEFLYFGRIEKLKGLDTLIEAACQANISLAIAGSGDYENRLEERIAKNTKIRYLGFLSGPRLEALVSSARAIVVPSEWFENCPMSILEAKAAGSPVIGARIGGIPELINEGLDGALFEPGNAGELSQIMIDFETQDIEAMGLEARNDVENRFSPSRHLDALLKIYKQTIAEYRIETNL